MMALAHETWTMPAAPAKPSIEIVVTCVDYADFLRLTLPHALRVSEQTTVLTAPWDRETQRLAQAEGARVLVTNAWRANGAEFNKARALNEWLEAPCDDQARWVISMDSDVLIDSRVVATLTTLDERGLYGVPRRMCADEREWNDYVDGRRPRASFPIDELPVVNGRLWGTVRSTNPAGLCGYFQLWKPATSAGARRFVESGTAASYDVRFGTSFPDELRALIQGVDVLHLGPPRLNWRGRVTSRWRNAKLLPPEGSIP